MSCTCIVLGVWLRFSTIGAKYSFMDEMYSSIHAAGFTLSDLSRLAPKGLVTAAELVKQFESPSSTRSAVDTVRVLAVTDPQHPPLYYLLLRAGETIFGDALALRRAVSATLGVALLAVVFWLASELSGSLTVAWASAALVAVSPYQLVFSQDVREYMLFELLAALSAVVLLRALRGSSSLLWAAYAMLLTLTLYSALFAVIVLLAFAVYAFLCSRAQGMRRLVPFAVSTGAAFLLFMPWVAALAMHWRYATSTNGWYAAPLPLKLYAAKLIFGVTSIFFDAEYLDIWFGILLAPIAIAAAVGAYRLIRSSEPSGGKLFVFSVVGTSSAAFLGSDLLLHASRATQERYLTFAFLIVEIGVAWGVSSGLERAGKERRIAAVSTGILIVGGAFSCLIASRQKIWWENNDGARLAAVAQLVDSRPGSLVLTTPYDALQLSDAMNPTTPIALNASAALQQRNAVIYAVDPTATVLRTLREGRQEPGRSIDLVISEQSALKSIHASVARAHRRSAALQGGVWRFDPTDRPRS
jgi:uncharacterized membrane protein